jgi:hypothetical protein
MDASAGTPGDRTPARTQDTAVIGVVIGGLLGHWIDIWMPLGGDHHWLSGWPEKRQKLDDFSPARRWLMKLGNALRLRRRALGPARDDEPTGRP